MERSYKAAAHSFSQLGDISLSLSVSFNISGSERNCFRSPWLPSLVDAIFNFEIMKSEVAYNSQRLIRVTDPGGCRTPLPPPSPLVSCSEDVTIKKNSRFSKRRCDYSKLPGVEFLKTASKLEGERKIRRRVFLSSIKPQVTMQ